MPVASKWDPAPTGHALLWKPKIQGTCAINFSKRFHLGFFGFYWRRGHGLTPTGPLDVSHILETLVERIEVGLLNDTPTPDAKSQKASLNVMKVEVILVVDVE